MEAAAAAAAEVRRGGVVDMGSPGFTGAARRFTVEVDCRAGWRVTVCSWNFSGGSQDRWRECAFFTPSLDPRLGAVVIRLRGRGVGEELSMEVGESLG